MTWSSVLQLEVLIGKILSIDRLITTSKVINNISTLKNKTHHCSNIITIHWGRLITQKQNKKTYLTYKLRYYPEENGSLVAKAMFSCTERSEVFYRIE